MRYALIIEGTILITYIILVFAGIVDVEQNQGKTSVFYFVMGAVLAITLAARFIYDIFPKKHSPTSSDETALSEGAKNKIKYFRSDSASRNELIKSIREKEQISGVRMLQFSGFLSSDLLATLIGMNKIASDAKVKIIVACPKIVPTDYQARRIYSAQDSFNHSEEFTVFRNNNNMEIKFYNFTKRNFPSMRARCFDFEPNKTWTKALLEFGWHTYDTNASEFEKGGFQISGRNPMLVHTASRKDDYWYEMFNKRFINYWEKGLTLRELTALRECIDCDILNCQIRQQSLKDSAQI